MTIDLEALKRIAQAASPGPWLLSELHGGVETTQVANNGDVYGGYLWSPDFDDDETEETRLAYLRRDGAFIAAYSPDVALALIAGLDDHRLATALYAAFCVQWVAIAWCMLIGREQ